MTAASGQKINVEHDDKSHQDQLYAEADHADLYVSATGLDITMDASPATLPILEETQAELDANISNGATAVSTTGVFTIDKAGDYELFLCGQVTGEEDEPVLFEWYKDPGDGTYVAMGEPHEANVLFDATLSNALIQRVSHVSRATLAKGEKLRLQVLGSASEVINLKRFNFGIRQIASANY